MKRLYENAALNFFSQKRNKGSSELKITQNEQYVLSDLSQRNKQKKLYDKVLRFDVKEGTKSGLVSMGGVINGPLSGYKTSPVFRPGMVQIKQEKGGIISFGLGTISEGISFFNEQIESVFRYNCTNSSWERLK